MKLTSYTHTGTRQNNEDYLGHSEHVFIVCDGMGGHANGEVASKFVVEEVLRSVGQLVEISKKHIEEVIEEVQINLNKKLEMQPELLKMGTTFTGVLFAKDKVFVAHIGDSRVYFIRPSEQQIWHTWDHSLVGGLMQSGEITREKGRLHPMSNRISKAITANETGKTVMAAIVQVNQLRKGDLFLLCSDGVNEAWQEHELMQLLCNTELSSKEKLDQIEKKCLEESRDNNTALLIEVEAKDIFDSGVNNEIDWLHLNDFTNDYNLFLENEQRELDEEEVMVEPESTNDVLELENRGKSSKRKYIYIVIIIVIALAITLFSI